MKWLVKIVIAVAANAIGLWVANAYVPGFVLSGAFKDIAAIAAILTALNFFLKPILKLVLGPIIILTLGLGIIVVNSIILYILDILSKNLTIETIPAYIWSAILISVINFMFHIGTK